MAVKIPKMAAADVPAPTRPDVVELFFDSSDNDVLKFKDKYGVVRVAIATTGSPIALAKQASAPAAATNTNKLYAREVSGNLEVFAKDNANQEVQLTNQGGPAASGGSVGMFWDAYDQLKVDVPTTAAFPYEIVMPTPLAPPAAQWCFYVATVRVVSSAENGWPFGSGGSEWDIILPFDDGPGTPDTRFYKSMTSFGGWSQMFFDSFPSYAFRLDPATVDASGVLTIPFSNVFVGPPPTAAKVAITVAGPFVHPQMVVPNL